MVEELVSLAKIHSYNLHLPPCINETSIFSWNPFTTGVFLPVITALTEIPNYDCTVNPKLHYDALTTLRIGTKTVKNLGDFCPYGIKITYRIFPFNFMVYKSVLHSEFSKILEGCKIMDQCLNE